MNKGNKIHRVIIAVFVIFIVFIGYLVFAESIRMSRLSSEISLIKQDIEKRQETLNQLRKLNKATDNLTEQNSAIKALIPDSPIEEEIILHIQGVSAECSVQPVTIRFSNRKEAGSLTEMPLELSFSGTYRGFLNLLSGLMYGDRFIRIDEIRLGQNSGSLNIDLKANAFYQAP